MIALEGSYRRLYGDYLKRSYSKPTMRDWMQKFLAASSVLQRKRGRHPSLSGVFNVHGSSSCTSLGNSLVKRHVDCNFQRNSAQGFARAGALVILYT